MPPSTPRGCRRPCPWAGENETSGKGGWFPSQLRASSRASPRGATSATGKLAPALFLCLVAAGTALSFSFAWTSYLDYVSGDVSGASESPTLVCTAASPWTCSCLLFPGWPVLRTPDHCGQAAPRLQLRSLRTAEGPGRAGPSVPGPSHSPFLARLPG